MTQTIPDGGVTYTLFGKGNFGPAHPLHNPAVTVSVHDKDDAIIGRRSLADGREGHLWALRQGYRLHQSQAHLAEQPRYEEYLTIIRYEESGL